MNLVLTRNKHVLYGVYGVLTDENNAQVAITLEHAYVNPDGTYSAKIPVGKYSCQRGQHRLQGMTNSFETFQIMDVPGHTNILFHKGNHNMDSEGCVLLGTSLGVGCILDSALAFGHFLDIQVGCDIFDLSVLD